jgi:hypothetical protein
MTKNDTKHDKKRGGLINNQPAHWFCGSCRTLSVHYSLCVICHIIYCLYVLSVCMHMHACPK